MGLPGDGTARAEGRMLAITEMGEYSDSSLTAFRGKISAAIFCAGYPTLINPPQYSQEKVIA